ncbi:sec1 family domain-containing protein 2-like isoform X2 [Sipha flava]|uniref:Sec1 family domain-containing protein 2-like isoform X2 n=1 Tax=Sipha flava TaxID=143950 RepID=A0A8B8F6A7_9HEMI|nr:sec1 family domain-containing protein 2-like isoform X2 [Sipha flava]
MLEKLRCSWTNTLLSLFTGMVVAYFFIELVPKVSKNCLRSRFDHSGHPKDRRCLLIVGKPVDESTVTIVRDVLNNSNFKYCRFIAGCGFESYDIEKLENELCKTVSSKYEDGTVDVMDIPISLTCLSPTLFLIPHLQDIPILIENNYQNYVSKISATLNNIFDHLNVRHDIYSIGPLSEAVSHHFSKIQKSVNSDLSRVNVILIDRIIDMYAVTDFASSCLLDKMSMLLNRFPKTCSDIAVTTEPLIKDSKYKEVNDQLEVPMCLAPTLKPTPVVEWLLTKNEKNVLANIRTVLTEKCSGPVRKTISRITPQLFETILSDEKFNNKENIDLKQQVLCICAALKSSNLSKIELAQNIGKLLLQNISLESDIDILTQVGQLFKTRKDRKLSLEILLCILIQLYSVVEEDFQISDEHQINLENMLGEAFYDDLKYLPEYIIKDFIGVNSITPLACQQAAENFIFILNQIKSSRQNFVQYRKLFVKENTYAPASYSSFVKQLMDDVCSPMRPNLPVLKTKSDGLTDFIKIGFNKIINTVNKHPLDCDHLIVFIIGGISGHEVHSICEATKNCGIRVSIGSTRMLSPYEALHSLFKRM